MLDLQFLKYPTVQQSQNISTYLHNPNNRATITRKIIHAGDHVSRIKESHGMRRHEDIQAHHIRRGPRQYPRNREPHQKVAGEALKRPGQEHDPRPTTAGDGGVEEAGEDSDVGTEVFEHRYGVEGGLIVTLGGFYELGVDAEGVERTGGALDPYAGGGGYPFVLDQGFSAGVEI